MSSPRWKAQLPEARPLRNRRLAGLSTASAWQPGRDLVPVCRPAGHFWWHRRACRPLPHGRAGRQTRLRASPQGPRRIEIAGHQRLRLASQASRETPGSSGGPVIAYSTSTARRRCPVADSGRSARSQRTCPARWRAVQVGEPPCAVSALRASGRLFRRQQAPMPGPKPASITGSPPSPRRPPEPALIANMRISPFS